MDNDKTVLLVDDELDIQKLTIMVLEDAGYNVLSVNNGKKALEIIKKQKIDILLIDYFMPEMTGEETIKLIREFNKELVIILQTAYSGEKPASDMLMELDIQNYYDKSHGVQELLIMMQVASKTVDLIRTIKQNSSDYANETDKSKTVSEILVTIENNSRSITNSVNGLRNNISDFKRIVSKYDKKVVDNLVGAVSSTADDIYSANETNMKYITSLDKKYKSEKTNEVMS
jgi:CheY-like chemotaxis protein